MTNVCSLPGVRDHTGQPNEALIQALRDTLAKAESGELQSLIGVGFTKPGLIYSLWGDAHDNVFEMLGAIAWMKAEYIERHVGDVIR